MSCNIGQGINTQGFYRIFKLQNLADVMHDKLSQLNNQSGLPMCT